MCINGAVALGGRLRNRLQLAGTLAVVNIQGRSTNRTSNIEHRILRCGIKGNIEHGRATDVFDVTLGTKMPNFHSV